MVENVFQSIGDAAFAMVDGAVRTAKRALRRAPKQAMDAKAAPFSFAMLFNDQPAWQIVDYETYVSEGFNSNTLVYSAIMYKERAQTSAPLRAWTGDVDNPDPLDADAPLSQLVARPNPHQSWPEFHGLNIVYENLSGNSYVWMDRPARGGLPDAMYGLRPDRVFPIPSIEDGVPTIRAYLYSIAGRVAFVNFSPERRREEIAEGRAVLFLPEDVMHVKFPNPGDRYEGMGYGTPPMSPVARSADIDNMITHFLKLFFDHGVILPGILSSDQAVSPEIIARTKERWKEMYGGYDRWSEEIGVLERGLKYQRIAPDFDEMGFGQQDERNETRILGPFGVPPILVGSRIGLLRSTYANYKEARIAFWQDTMVPENLAFEVDYRYYLATEGEEFVAFDYTKVPAFQELRDKEKERSHDAFTAGAITRNEYRRALGLPEIEDGQGDRFVLSPALIEVPLLMAGTEERTEEGAASAEEETRKSNIVPLHAQKKKGASPLRRSKRSGSR